MLLFAVIVALVVIACYCVGAWCLLGVKSWQARGTWPREAHDAVERYTFHLGLCMVLALGFLGLILR